MMGGGDPQHKAVKIVEGWRGEGREREVNAVNDVSVNEWIDARLRRDGRRRMHTYVHRTT